MGFGVGGLGVGVGGSGGVGVGTIFQVPYIMQLWGGGPVIHKIFPDIQQFINSKLRVT